MRCRHLSLTNFRTYRRLEFDVPAGVSLCWGNNAQGKTNLLEAFYMLATTKSFRTNHERELISWDAGPDERFTRISAEVERQHSTMRLDITLAEPPRAVPGETLARRPQSVPHRLPGRSVHKRVRINQQPRRAMDLLGQFNVVLFAPEDVELVTGSPAQRRRYLDITLCQVDSHYLRVLTQYNRVLAQRNALLRQLRDRPAREGSGDQLAYWTEQVVTLGSAVILTRAQAIAALNTFLAQIHPRLVDERVPLHIVYRSNVAVDELASGVSPDAARAEALRREVRDQFAARLGRLHSRERRQAVTLAGPHRDDLTFTTAGVDLHQYGSRGQQRTASLAIKLAEIEFMQQRTGERPVLLLDDVLSELDPQRRRLLQEAVTGAGQVLLTATELQPFTRTFLSQVAVFEAAKSVLRPAAVER